MFPGICTLRVHCTLYSCTLGAGTTDWCTRILCTSDACTSHLFWFVWVLVYWHTDGISIRYKLTLYLHTFALGTNIVVLVTEYKRRCTGYKHRCTECKTCLYLRLYFVLYQFELSCYYKLVLKPPSTINAMCSNPYITYVTSWYKI
jgi:hypothetical protein